MFCGILIGHIEALLIAVEPTPSICSVVQVTSHFLMMLTVCPLLVKTFRIWLVYTTNTQILGLVLYVILVDHTILIKIGNDLWDC